MGDILDDIWECAAELHGAASRRKEEYRGYMTRERRCLDDIERAKRVMDWVRERRGKA